MLFNIELPKKLNKYNYFKKVEQGSRLYSYNGNLGTDNYIICDYPDLEIEKDFCVMNTTLETILKLQPNVDVAFNSDMVIAKSSKGKFSAKYVESVLSVPMLKFENSCGIDLEKLMVATNFASTNEKKPILTGVNLDDNGVIVATDSFKLYKYENENITQPSQSNITISANFIKMADSLFTNKLLFASYNKNIVCIKENNLMLVGNLLDGVYPNISSIFNKVNDEIKVLNKQELLEAIDIAKISGNAVVGKEKLFYATLDKNKFICSGNEKFEKDINYDGNIITLNANYLELALKTFTSDNVNIQVAPGGLSCLSAENSNTEKIILLGIKKN